MPRMRNTNSGSTIADSTAAWPLSWRTSKNFRRLWSMGCIRRLAGVSLRNSGPWESQNEGGSMPGDALAVDRAFMGLEDLPGYGEAQAGAALLGGEERLEDPLFDV